MLWTNPPAFVSIDTGAIVAIGIIPPAGPLAADNGIGNVVTCKGIGNCSGPYSFARACNALNAADGIGIADKFNGAPVL